MKADVVETCKARLLPHLDKLHSELAALPEVVGCGVEARALGIKVWIVPPIYYRLQTQGPAVMTNWLDVSFLNLWPALKAVGEVASPLIVSTGRRWTVGKGLLGQALRDNDQPKEYRILIHGEDWGTNISKMKRREFKQVDANIRLGRSLRDFQGLSARYGSAVGVGLKLKDEPAFGCITVHSAVEQPMSKQAAVDVGEVVVNARSKIAEYVLEHSGYNVGRWPTLSRN